MVSCRQRLRFSCRGRTGSIVLWLKPEKESHLLDIIAGLNTEAYRVQARALTTGSDGLADLPEDHLYEIVLPKVTDRMARERLQAAADNLIAGLATVAKVVEDLESSGRLPAVAVSPRPSHTVLV